MSNTDPSKSSQSMLDLRDDIDQLLTRGEEEACCTFCGKRRSEVDVLVPGTNAGFICDQCVMRAMELITARQS